MGGEGGVRGFEKNVDTGNWDSIMESTLRWRDAIFFSSIRKMNYCKLVNNPGGALINGAWLRVLAARLKLTTRPHFSMAL